MHGAARNEVDRQLCESLDELCAIERKPTVELLTSPPPRRVGVAFAHALFAQPNLAVMFEPLVTAATEGVQLPAPHAAQTPHAFSNEALHESLGLAQWELEEIREDVDLRAGALLKQSRALGVLWTQSAAAQGPSALFKMLFPGVPTTSELARRGAQLYAITPIERPPSLLAMSCPWTDDDPRTLHPLRAFRGRYVDENLRRSLGRSVGAGGNELIALLEQMVTLVPQADHPRFLAMDSWRARGFSTITELPGAYTKHGWIAKPLDHDSFDPPWIVRKDGTLHVANPTTAFDQLAAPRVDDMLRCLYGAILAGAMVDDPAGSGAHVPRDLDLFDVDRHVKAVLRPLLDWAVMPKTAQYLASQRGVSVESVTAFLHELHATWEQHLLHAWCGPPREAMPRSMAAIFVQHLAVVQDGLRRAIRHRTDPRGDHRDTLLLFLAFYLVGAPLDRIWAEASASVFPPDPAGAWFWALWTRILDRPEEDTLNP